VTVARQRSRRARARRPIAASLVVGVVLTVLLAASPVRAAEGVSDADDFRRRVEQAYEIAQSSTTLVETESEADELVGRIAGLLPGAERVRYEDRVVEVDDSVLAARLAELDVAPTPEVRRTAVERVAEHLRSLRAAVGARGGEPVPEDPETLSALLATGEEGEPGFLADLVRRALEWLESLFGGIEFSQSSGSELLIQAVLWLVGIGLGGLLVWLLSRAVRARRARREGAKPGEDDTPAIVPAAEGLPRDALSYADELARDGRFRDALRALFGGAAREIVRAGIVRQTRTLTNGELLRAVRPGSSTVHVPLAALAGAFDVSWYGHADPGPRGYAAARDLYEAVLRATGARATQGDRS
jgi:hypothetical protein